VINLKLAKLVDNGEFFGKKNKNKNWQFFSTNLISSQI
jgi:hypothetical protein